MNGMFERAAEQQRRAEGFLRRMEELCAALAPFACYVEMGEAEALRLGFARRVESFYQENRRFRLAVAGRVKAGKSTFLNTLLFGGERVLPEAATPKTAAVTCIEYGEEAVLAVEFLSREEWGELARLAALGMETPPTRAARELAEAARRFGTPLEDCFGEGSRRIPLEGQGDLEALLNEYVGENGRYTPVVSALTLRLPLESLREVTVVDTPGLNDPVQSRTERTRAVLETCDAVFFLSRCGSFLDRGDLDLLAAQLPHKGAAALVLAASQLDSALIDLLPAHDGLEEALVCARGALTARAEARMGAALERLRKAGCPAPALAALEGCRRPVFFSAMAEKLSRAGEGERTPQEELLLRLLGNPGPGTLAKVGNLGEVRKIFSDLAARKDELLRRRGESLTEAARGELRLLLARMGERARALRREKLELRAGLEERQRELTARLEQVRAEVDGAFGEYLAPLEETLLHTLAQLDRLEGEWGEPERREGVEVQTKSATESAARLTRPWTWGKRRTVYSTRRTPYSYLDPGDARWGLEQLWQLTARLHTAAFLPFSDTARLRNRLLAAVERQFPPQSPARRPERLGPAVESALGRLSAAARPEADRGIPDFSLPGGEEVRDPAGQAALLEASRRAARRLAEDRRRRARLTARRLREWALQAEEGFLAAVCGELLEERRSSEETRAALEGEAGRLQELLELLERSY